MITNTKKANLLITLTLFIFFTSATITQAKELIKHEDLILDSIYLTTLQLIKSDGITMSFGNEQIEENEKIIEREEAEKISRGLVPSRTRLNSIIIESDERDLLERLVEAEAKGESFEGKIAVANVVINRVESEVFPNTITKVINQKGQFTPVSSGSIKNKASKESKLAVSEVVDKGFRPLGKDILYFCNVKTATSKWMINNKEKAVTIGNHTFFRK